MQLQPKSNERLVSEIVRKVRNKYTRTGLNQADQLDTLWNDLGRTPDWVIGCFEESIKEALAQKDAEVTIGGLTLKLMEGDYYWVTNEDGEGQGISKERLYHEMNDMFNRLF